MNLKARYEPCWEPKGENALSSIRLKCSLWRVTLIGQSLSICAHIIEISPLICHCRRPTGIFWERTLALGAATSLNHLKGSSYVIEADQINKGILWCIFWRYKDAYILSNQAVSILNSEENTQRQLQLKLVRCYKFDFIAHKYFYM
jgi:hypothetical protein